MFGWLRKKPEEPSPPIILLTDEERELVVKVLNTATARGIRLHASPVRFGKASGAVAAMLFEQRDWTTNGWSQKAGYGVTVYDALENLLGDISLRSKWDHQDEVKRNRKQSCTDAPGEKKCD